MNCSSSRAVVRPLLLSMFVLSACGRFGLQPPRANDDPTIGPPIALFAPTMEPGCFTTTGRHSIGPSPDLTETEAQLLVAEQQIREFRMSYTIQEAILVRTLVERDPTALHWLEHNIDERGEMLIEGFSSARSESWGRLHFTVTFLPSDAPNAPPAADINADVRFSAQSTRYDFGDHAFDVHKDHVVMEFDEGSFIRGCDPRSETSFEVQPINSLSAAVVDRTTCWRADDPAPVFETEREATEFAASQRLQCLQIVERITL